jgi:hypothetical protein
LRLRSGILKAAEEDKDEELDLMVHPKKQEVIGAQGNKKLYVVK